MKTKLYIKTAFVALVSMASLSSCLKDDKHYVDFASAKPLIEIPSVANVGGSGGLFQPVVVDNAPSVPVNLAVNLASPHTLTSATTVTLSVDQAALTAYNTANGKNYLLLPASDYTSTLSATIPAGQNLANVVINVKSSLIDPSITTYVLPLTITNGGGQQISNYKTVLLNIQAKNIYDGTYTVTGTMNDTGVPTILGNYPRTVNLITQGGNSVGYSDNGSYAHSIISSGTVTTYGSFAPVFNFDLTTNKITSVVNYYGQPAGNGRSARLDVTGINALSGTPGQAGSVIKVKYVLVASGADRTFFDETLTWKSSRP
ncbi:DUF1735 domain-containing protein [Mucilaginibacter sp. NFX135]|uniref:DUF1735 domain-containing protein n=1 Tax=Mucilaginibacter sp. NFX135 TaxID=3402687 RepID=UPI003AFB3A32